MTNSRLWMMTSSSGNIFRVNGLCEGNPSVTSEFPSQRPVTLSFDVFFDLRLNEQLCKQSRYRLFGTSLRSLWCHCNRYYHFCGALVVIFQCYQCCNMLITPYIVLAFMTIRNQHKKVTNSGGLATHICVIWLDHHCRSVRWRFDNG